MLTTELSPDLMDKLRIVQDELKAANLNDALDQSLNIAHFVTEILKDSKSRLLVERDGRFEQIKEF